MKQLMWHLVWVLMALWAACQKMQAGPATHVLLIGSIGLLVFCIVKHDKIAFVKTFRDEKLTYED